MRGYRHTPVALLLLLFLACGGGGRKETSAQASEQLKAMINSTTAAIAEGVTATVGPDAPRPQACVNVIGKDKGTVSFDSSVKMTLRPDADVLTLLERARQQWKSDGYKVGEVVGADTPAPDVLAERGGYGLRLAADRDERQITIGGSTPCVRETKDAPAG